MIDPTIPPHEYKDPWAKKREHERAKELGQKMLCPRHNWQYTKTGKCPICEQEETLELLVNTRKTRNIRTEEGDSRVYVDKPTVSMLPENPKERQDAIDAITRHMQEEAERGDSAE